MATECSVMVAGSSVMGAGSSVMGAGSEVNTVWMGFMDIVPVIGTVKEAVELVLALYEGNEAVIKEKEKAVENFVKELGKKCGRKLSEKPAADTPAAAAVSEFSGLINIREVRKEMIIEVMMKGSKRPLELSSAEQEAREEKLKAINQDVAEKLTLINPNFKQDLNEQMERSKRGEHVFNTNMLKFHSKVLIKFIQARNIGNLEGYNQQVMNDLCRHTLTQNTKNEIQKNMVVHFALNEFYVNANALLYGEYARALHVALLAVLNHINTGDVPGEERQRVTDLIDNMNNLEIYVDQVAKVKWISNRQDRQRRFDVVRQEVVIMYRDSRGVSWCDDILRVVAPLFGR